MSRYKLGVVGQPVAHSLSPTIHRHFAEQFSLKIDYQKIPSTPETFAATLEHFFAQPLACGLNITLPFKSQAARLVANISAAAAAAKSVNTLIGSEIDSLRAETTDGEGLVRSLNYLGIPLQQQSVLLMGAGGAARAIIPALIQQGAIVYLWNRTHNKAVSLVDEYHGSFGYTSEQLTLSGSQPSFSLIINTLPSDAAHYLSGMTLNGIEQTSFYDISYGERADEALNWSRHAGFKQCFDGWGMLIEQAALAFQLWFDELPDTQWLHQQSPHRLAHY